MPDLRIHVGDTLDEMGDRFIDAWHRAESGELNAALPEHHVSFDDFSTFSSIMTPKRLALLRHVHGQPQSSIRALARSLGRDYRRVHADVEALAGAGLLHRGPDGLKTEYDTFRIETLIAL